ncbi:MAG: hypothetical protein Q9160_001715 [Pyrenula sp. 1 TL-2023]
MATSVDAKLLRQTKFPSEFNQKVDMRKVNVEVLKKWIASRISELLGDDDDVVIELVFNLLEGNRFPDIKSLQISLTGFLDKDAPKFCRELWALALSAQTNPQGVPKELLEAKKMELIQEKRRKKPDVGTSMRLQGIGILIQYANGNERRGDGAEAVFEDENLIDVGKDRDRHNMGDEAHQVGQIVAAHLRDPKWIPTYLQAETVAEARDDVAAQDPRPAPSDTLRHHLLAHIGVERTKTTDRKGDTIAPDLRPGLRPADLMVEEGRLVLVEPINGHHHLIQIRLGHGREQEDGKDPTVPRQGVQILLLERAAVIEEDPRSPDLGRGLGDIGVTTDTKIGQGGIAPCPPVLTIKEATEGLILRRTANSETIGTAVPAENDRLGNAVQAEVPVEVQAGIGNASEDALFRDTLQRLDASETPHRFPPMIQEDRQSLTMTSRMVSDRRLTKIKARITEEHQLRSTSSLHVSATQSPLLTANQLREKLLREKIKASRKASLQGTEHAAADHSKQGKTHT